jgi:hypothetical protein
MRKVEDWLNGGVKSPRERLLKELLNGIQPNSPRTIAEPAGSVGATHA